MHACAGPTQFNQDTFQTAWPETHLSWNQKVRPCFKNLTLCSHLCVPTSVSTKSSEAVLFLHLWMTPLCLLKTVRPTTRKHFKRQLKQRGSDKDTSLPSLSSSVGTTSLTYQSENTLERKQWREPKSSTVRHFHKPFSCPRWSRQGSTAELKQFLDYWSFCCD